MCNYGKTNFSSPFALDLSKQMNVISWEVNFSRLE